MAKQIDELVQEANDLSPAVVKYRTRLVSAGMKEEELASFTTTTDALSGKSVAQKEKKAERSGKTQTEDEKIAQGHLYIQKIKDTVKGMFGRNSAERKEFHVGLKISGVVEELRQELKYMYDTAKKYEAVLGTRGIKQKQLQRLLTAREELLAADAVQKGAQVDGVNLTAARNLTRKELKTMITAIRTTASNEFEDEPDIQREFGLEPEKKRKTRKKKVGKGGKTEPLTK